MVSGHFIPDSKPQKDRHVTCHCWGAAINSQKPSRFSALSSRSGGLSRWHLLGPSLGQGLRPTVAAHGDWHQRSGGARPAEPAAGGGTGLGNIPWSNGVPKALGFHNGRVKRSPLRTREMMTDGSPQLTGGWFFMVFLPGQD